MTKQYRLDIQNSVNSSIQAISIFFIILICSCQQNTATLLEEGISVLTEEDRKVINQFTLELEQSLNYFEYRMLKNDWSDGLFKNRIEGVTTSQKTVLDHYYEKFGNSQIRRLNADVVNKIKPDKGKVSISDLTFHANSAELTLISRAGNKISFLKYLIKMEGEGVKLCDIYSFKNDQWFSEDVADILILNSQNRAGSKLRTDFHKTMEKAQKLEKLGKYQESLELITALSQSIPDNLSIILTKLHLSALISDSIYLQTMANENTNYRYIEYLRLLSIQESVEKNEFYNTLTTDLGTTTMIDSLASGHYLWD